MQGIMKKVPQVTKIQFLIFVKIITINSYLRLNESD